MAPEEWRIVEVLKLLRQCVVCPLCGALVTTEAGVTAHKNWHSGASNKVDQIDTRFRDIDTYVRGENGMEQQIVDAITKVRTDATTAITQLRSDATSAINALVTRVTALEQNRGGS